MIRSILLGLDGSEYSKTGLELGVRWAKQFNALLVGLCVVDPQDISKGEMVPIGGAAFKAHRDEAQLEKARWELDQLLEHFSLRCSQEGISSKVLEDEGPAHEQIVLEAQRYDLILLGKRTYFHQPRYEGPDDTLERILRNGPRPVVTAPEGLHGGDGILVAYDGSLPAARALFAFAASGLGQEREHHILTLSDNKTAAARHADRAADYLGAHGLKVTTHPLTGDKHPEEVILDQAYQLQAGMIVMGAYGKSTLWDFFLGSTTKRLLEKSPLPLFMFH